MRYEYLTTEALYDPTFPRQFESLNKCAFMYAKEGDTVRLRYLHTAALTDGILSLQFNEVVSERKMRLGYDKGIGCVTITFNIEELSIKPSSVQPLGFFIAIMEPTDDWSLYELLTEYGDIDPDPDADTVTNFQQDKSRWISEMYPGEVNVMQQVTVKDTVTLQEVTWYRLVRNDDDPVPMEKVLDTFRKTFPRSMIVTKSEVVSYAIAETTLYKQTYSEGT